MWQRDSTSEWVRIGRVAVERWRGRPGAMQLLGTRGLPPGPMPSFDDLAVALNAVMASPPASATVLLESAWMPALLADTGGTVWSAAQLDALLRHRLGGVYRDAADPVSGWALRVHHRPGDRWALGIGMSPKLHECLETVARQIGFDWKAMVPACAWGQDLMRPTRVLPQRTGWWLWPEQDRQLLVRFERGAIQGLNAAVAIDAHDAAQVSQGIAVEAIRHGLRPVPDVCVSSWRPLAGLPVATDGVQWASILGVSEALPVTRGAGGPRPEAVA